MQDPMNLNVREICGAVRIHAIPHVLKKREDRPRWAVAIKHEGVTEYYSSGKLFLSDPTHICLLPKGSSYEWQTAGGECLMIEFEADRSGDEPLSIQVKDSSEIVNLYHQIESERLQNNHPYASMAAMYRILSILLDHREKDYSLTDKERLILPAFNAIQKGFADQDFTIKGISQLAGISEVYFRKIFAEVYGCPPQKYLTHLRMKKAAELLQTDYSSVENVAEAVGYHSLYHFSKMFKKYYGVSPNNYCKG